MLLSCVSAGMAADRNILPDPADPRLLELGLSAWNAALAEAEDANRADKTCIARARAWSGTPEGERLLAALFGNSPFLGGVAVAEWDFLTRLIDEGADAAVRGNSSPRSRRREDSGEDRGVRLMRALRLARRRVALLAAVAELAGSWSLEQPDGGAEPLCRRRDRRRAAPSAARAARMSGAIYAGRSGRPGARAAGSSCSASASSAAGS